MLLKGCGSGCLFGLALGDALGAVTEFLNVDEILRRFPPNGPQEPTGNPARVTDDTQMALCVGEALIEAGGVYTASSLEPLLRRAFVTWLHSPDNNRAPGRTCLNACGKLEEGLPWERATVADSKGCGANMRVAPVGLLPLGGDSSLRGAIAQFQAALTHGHPTALAASDLTAYAIADLAAGGTPEQLPQRLRSYALSQRTVYRSDWLGSLWQRPYINTPEEFISRGWDECLSVLDRLDAALAEPNRDRDPCEATGEGWIAEEAFATGLLCFLLFPEEPVAALRRAAVTSGDSDSIACLTGAFAGAYLGMEAWPSYWTSRIEYRQRLAALGELWDG
ncbi:ADP-ribosylglycohydrolase family protein [Planktothrix sp. FACHB-1355]|uniref:ADP-ribosylglycohydrolase family protein n=1 Tax=Aerosakkonema funiforme FACHB-1375 TaxID=2949571 RepID=A0A926ZI50_9CYAN|nr:MULTISPECIES: ADP-ribosylglycohydrolase family protein [Oscillatoriales]MBD2181431.1 ADP-ribosylglycohydrolase family protein [Aerosakkonema funiforme FACHB-1375]MBD3557696.1 ADP-ribosylglycohydrolase family protein [Planktothrix sp. FACHB-1355]